jgi:hypothetical protein
MIFKPKEEGLNHQENIIPIHIKEYKKTNLKIKNE